MNSASHALSRGRTLALQPERFRQLAIAAVAMLIIIVGTGASVRLTGSGLGCPHWPGCEQQDVLPKGYHSYVEFSNRVVAFFTVVTTLALAVGALRTRGLERRTKVLAWIVFGGTLAQAPLGAITIYFDLNPYLVIAHLLLSLAVIGVAVLVLVEATQRQRGVAFPRAVRALGALLLVAITFLVVTGTLSTASGKFPGANGDTKVHRLGAFVPAVSLHVKAVATFGVVFLALAAWAVRNRTRYPWLVRRCAGLLAILLAQMAVGETQYRTYGTVPWWVVLIHVILAAALFGWTVGLVARLWRPIAGNVA